MSAVCDKHASVTCLFFAGFEEKENSLYANAFSYKDLCVGFVVVVVVVVVTVVVVLLLFFCFIVPASECISKIPFTFYGGS